MGPESLSRMASLAMAVAEAIAFITLGVFCALFAFSGDTRLDTLLAIVFGFGSFTFAVNLWSRWRRSRP
jgi:Na+/phosphate symporter